MSSHRKPQPPPSPAAADLKRAELAILRGPGGQISHGEHSKATLLSLIQTIVAPLAEEPREIPGEMLKAVSRELNVLEAALASSEGDYNHLLSETVYDLASKCRAMGELALRLAAANEAVHEVDSEVREAAE